MNQWEPPYILIGALVSPVGTMGDTWALHFDSSAAIVVAENGRIAWVGSEHACPIDYRDWARIRTPHLIFPGFIDSHIHYPQIHVRAAYGADLLDWLERYTFPEEGRFVDPTYAQSVARTFSTTLLAQGVTTACTFSTSHGEAFLALTSEAAAAGLHLVTGVTAMDRYAPEAVARDLGYFEDVNAMAYAHLQQFTRMAYAVTPRFAISCTEPLLRACGEFVAAHPDVWIQSHVNENAAEIQLTRQLFPDHANYVGVYADFGLLTDKTILAHSIYTTAAELRLLADAQTTIVHCPTSNTFLGSGLFDAGQHEASGIHVTLGSDVGGGFSFSPFATMAEAYKVGRLRGQSITADRLLYWHTLGAAHALGLSDIGSIEVGSWADFCLVDPASTPLAASRWHQRRSFEDGLFGLLFTLPEAGGGIAATCTSGRLRWSRA